MSNLASRVGFQRRTIQDALPQPCAHCPWRISNQGTPHPHGFFDKANIRRLWDGLRKGDAPGMSCHPTDPRMAEFEGYEGTSDKTMHECAGSLIVIARELARFKAHCYDVEREEADGAKFRHGEALRRYRRENRNGMTHEGLAEMAWMVATGQIRLPGDAARVNDPDIGTFGLTSWDPEILVRSEAMDS